jgi:hypothetical protein
MDRRVSSTHQTSFGLRFSSIAGARCIRRQQPWNSDSGQCDIELKHCEVGAGERHLVAVVFQLSVAAVQRAFVRE